MKANRNFGTNTMAVLIFILIGIFIIYTFLREKKESSLLMNSKTGIAILIEINGNAHAAASGDFRYKVKSKKYEFNQSGDYSFMQIGDTVLIEYAVDDCSVARVVDKYYMSKYHKLNKD